MLVITMKRPLCSFQDSSYGRETMRFDVLVNIHKVTMRFPSTRANSKKPSLVETNPSLGLASSQKLTTRRESLWSGGIFHA